MQRRKTSSNVRPWNPGKAARRHFELCTLPSGLPHQSAPPAHFAFCILHSLPRPLRPALVIWHLSFGIAAPGGSYRNIAKPAPQTLAILATFRPKRSDRPFYRTRLITFDPRCSTLSRTFPIYSDLPRARPQSLARARGSDRRRPPNPLARGSDERRFSLACARGSDGLFRRDGCYV